MANEKSLKELRAKLYDMILNERIAFIKTHDSDTIKDCIDIFDDLLKSLRFPIHQ